MPVGIKSSIPTAAPSSSPYTLNQLKLHTHLYDVQPWNKIYENVQAVLSKVNEEIQKQTTIEGVKFWLEDLNQVMKVYKRILDKLQTFELVHVNDKIVDYLDNLELRGILANNCLQNTMRTYLIRLTKIKIFLTDKLLTIHETKWLLKLLANKVRDIQILDESALQVFRQILKEKLNKLNAVCKGIEAATSQWTHSNYAKSNENENVCKEFVEYCGNVLPRETQRNIQEKFDKYFDDAFINLADGIDNNKQNIYKIIEKINSEITKGTQLLIDIPDEIEKRAKNLKVGPMLPIAKLSQLLRSCVTGDGN